MSLLCSCGGRRRKKKKTGDNSDYYSRTPTPSIAPTPKVKRKFPEGVVSLPSVPSDLEEAVGQLPTVSPGQRDSPPQDDEHLLIVSQQETVHHEGNNQEPVVCGSLQMTLKTKDSPPQSSELEDAIQKNEERPLSTCAETQCDFADFDDDLLCFQEEEEYLSQVSDIKSKTPSLWDDTSSLKSSELFDVIQGEVEHFPKKIPSTDEVWKDIKYTLLTLINDKDSDLVQELRTPLEEISCPNFRASSRDVDVICKHIDDYFAAQENPMLCADIEPQLRDEASALDPNESAKQGALVDKGVHFDLEEAPLRLPKNNIGNRLYDNFQMHVGILMPEAKPKSTLSRHIKREDTEFRFENSPASSINSVNNPPLIEVDSECSYEGLKKQNEEIPHTNTEEHLVAYNDIVSSEVSSNECETKLVETNKNKSTIMNGLALKETLDKYPKVKDHANYLEGITSKNQVKDNVDTAIFDDEALNKEIEEFLEVDVICPITLEEEISAKDVAQLVEIDKIEPKFFDDEALNKEVNEFLEVKIPSILDGDTSHESVGQLLEIDSKSEPSILDDEILNDEINEFFEETSSTVLDDGLSDENASQLSDAKDINTNVLNKVSLSELKSINLDCSILNKDVEELLVDNEENSLAVMKSEDVYRVENRSCAGQSKFHNVSLDKVVDKPFEDKWLVSPFSFDYKFLESPSQFDTFESQAVSDSAALLQAIHDLASGIQDVPFCGNASTNESNNSREDSVLCNNADRLLGICTPLDTEEESRIDGVTPHRGINTSTENEEGVQEATKPALDLAQNSNVQDAFVIAVEQQARERLERLSALKRIKPVDMTKLSQQLNQQIPATEQQQELNGFIESSPIYVTSIPPSSAEPPPTARRRGGAGVAVKVTPGAGGGGTSTTNGHASSVEEPDSAAEIELKQELEEEEPAAEPLPSGSPFANGRTEVLIGQDEVAGRLRTTAIVETSDERPRRRSGSSIAVVEAGGVQDKPVPDDDMMMMTLDNGPHREMAVDVPDSFIARSKTPPRYPPPRPQTRVPTTTTSPPGLNGSVTAPKPVPPPRDHLRIERDGRLVNRAPAPQVPARTVINNNNNNNNNTEREPTKEQLDSIRKFQLIDVYAPFGLFATTHSWCVNIFGALRKRKEEEERVAQQNESSTGLCGVPGSFRRLKVTHHPLGSSTTATPRLTKSNTDTGRRSDRHRYGELVASLQRLQLQLKKSSLGQGGYSSLEGQLAAVQTLLLSPQFGRALAVHNKVQQVWNGRVPPPASSHAQNLVRDCLDALQPCSLADAAELADLLTRYEIEGLLHAHDAIAAASAASGITMGSPLEEETPAQLPGGENIRIIKIEKTNEPLGATVRNEGDAVIIGRIVRGGAAEKSGLLHEGDEVLEVNGIEMRCKSVNEVCDILSGMTGTLTFLIVPKSAARPALPSPRDNLLHMRAHFDYDPEEDLYIPCRELGISFQKGDVLHVISQEDPNWWQAYREGEEDQTLAGLIPSRSFQHQRESMKQTIAGDKLTREKTKKAGTLLCAKKNPKKKKKKLPYNDGGYPLYATSTIDDYDADEILTYEEVALYYPRANHKRPIVLIGPSNIGRHELRQRLMEDAERFAAAIPHTSRARKEGEVDGQDYHFISRAQFESDILARKFVEHGEYEKAYYGTSLDAIRSVVNSGKICVLNLHPQSLKILRGSDLKPYVVFVAPPSLEKLRQKKMRSGEAYKEDELKDIIEKAREMEDKYDHYFDKVIVNSDTDRAYHQLLNEINALEREPQWVPASWVKAT